LQATKEAALLEMRAENEKLDIEREAAQRLLSEMEDAGAQKAAELAALARENESLSQERTEMERLVSTAQQQAEATSLELSHTVEENLKLRESAESMQVELHRLKAEKLAQQVRSNTGAMPHAHLRAKMCTVDSSACPILAAHCPIFWFDYSELRLQHFDDLRFCRAFVSCTCV